MSGQDQAARPGCQVPTKVCTKCNLRKPLEEFGKRKSAKDGHMAECKKCKCKSNGLYYINNTEKIKEIISLYRKNNPEKVAARKRLYCKNNPEKEAERSRLYIKRHPDQRATTVSKYNRNNPEKIKAHGILNSAILDGKITRGPCEVCRKPDADGHHDDYSKPLDVRWLCRQHHKDHHRLHPESVEGEGGAEGTEEVVGHGEVVGSS